MLEVSNKDCVIRIYYGGDYIYHFNNSCIDPKLLNVVYKTQKCNFDIEVNPLRIMSGAFVPDMYSQSEVDDFIEELKKTKNAAVELQEIIKTYFKIEYNF